MYLIDSYHWTFYIKKISNYILTQVCEIKNLSFRTIQTAQYSAHKDKI